MSTCQHCGREHDANAESCPDCAARDETTRENTPSPPTPEPNTEKEDGADQEDGVVDPAHPLPALPPYPFEAAALKPTPKPPTSLLRAIYYGLRTLGLRSRHARCLNTVKLRREALARSLESLLVEIGRTAWKDRISTPALDVHRDAIEGAQRKRADLKDQVATLEEEFEHERQRAREQIAAHEHNIDGLERQHKERDHVYQQVARDLREAQTVLREVQKEVAAAQKKRDRLQALPTEKHTGETEQQVHEIEREIDEIQSGIPQLETRVVSLTKTSEERKAEVMALRAELREERATLTKLQRKMDKRERDVETQQSTLLGEQQGTESAMRGPFMEAGRELTRARAEPSLRGHFAAFEEHAAALAAEETATHAFNTAFATFDRQGARRGRLLASMILLTIMLVVASAMFISRACGQSSPGVRRALSTALPHDLSAVLALNVAEARRAPLLRPFIADIDTVIAAHDHYPPVLATASEKPSGFHTLAVGARILGSGVPALLVTIGGTFDQEQVIATLRSEESEERVTDTGARRFIAREREVLVAHELILFATGKGAAILSDSPLSRAEGTRSAAENTALRRTLRLVDATATAWAVMLIDPESLALVRALRPVADWPLAAGDQLAISLDVSSGITLSVAARLTQAERATQLGAQLRAGLRGLKTGLGALPSTSPRLATLAQELAALIDHATLTTDRETVRLLIEVPRKTVRSATKLLDAQLRQWITETLREFDRVGHTYPR